MPLGLRLGIWLRNNRLPLIIILVIASLVLGYTGFGRYYAFRGEDRSTSL